MEQTRPPRPFPRGWINRSPRGCSYTAIAAQTAVSQAAGNLYRSIGVRPVINARGTFTIISGSQTLPEVKRAMEEASRSYVQMDELMDGVSKRLAELTGAEWGIVTNGCCAAIAHTTSASIAGSNPERMQRLPDVAELKNEVIIPAYSRNVYDHAVRMVGVKIIEVKNPAELESAFNARTAMVYILARARAMKVLSGQRLFRPLRRNTMSLSWWMPRPKFSRSPTSICKGALPLFAIAAENAFAVRRQPDSFLARRRSCKPHG